MQPAAVLIPVNGAKVRDPKTLTYLAEEGEVKPLIRAEGRYWRRRINDGSVMIKPALTRTTKKTLRDLDK